jgi:deazaflavin-dependent oxidoreductase (nitroreductase family)
MEEREIFGRASKARSGFKTPDARSTDTVWESMSEAERLFGQEHVRRYRETNGAVGHIWKRGAKTLLLTTSGRRTGKPTTTPLIYQEAGDNYVVVASRGGAPEHPGWYRNLMKNPDVEVQVKHDVFKATARTATGDEREELWKLAAQQWPDYDLYQHRTGRQIPVVVLERARAFTTRTV